MINLKKFFLLTLFVSITLLLSYGSFRYVALPRDAKIMHAMGAINNVTYTNSREAFEFHYSEGNVVFEVDLALTSDSQIVAHHGKWGNSYTEFLARRVRGKYSPLSLDDLLDLLARHKDVVMITDTKDNLSAILPQVIAAARRKDPMLVKRLIPQIYQEADIRVLEATGFTGDTIYTLYKSSASNEEVLAFVLRHPQIRAVTMSKYRFSWSLTHALAKIGRKTYVHTVNNPLAISLFLGLGANGIYTDDG